MEKNNEQFTKWVSPGIDKIRSVLYTLYRDYAYGERCDRGVTPLEIDTYDKDDSIKRK